MRGRTFPDWSAGLPAWGHRRCAALRSRRGGAGARRRARRVLRRHPRQPLSPRIDRDARAAGAERVALDQLRPRAARAGQRRVGLCRDQPRRAGRGARAAPNRRWPSPAPTRVLATRKVVLANADKVVTTWTSAVQARSVRGAARNQDRVPDEAERDRAGGAGRVSFVSSQVLFVDEQKYFASSEGSRITQRLVRTYPQFTTTAADRASGDFQTRAVVDRAQLVGYEYVEDYPWLQDAEKAGHEVVEKLKAEAGRRPAATTSSSIRRSCSSRIHESVGHSTELDRSLGWEANMAGHQLPQAGRRRQAALRREDRQPGRRSHAARRPGDDRVRRRRGEGGALAPGARRHVRGLADDARAGAARRPAALARLPARRQLVERAVPADAERLARSRRRPRCRSTTCSATSSAGCSSKGAASRRSISSATTSSSAAR